MSDVTLILSQIESGDPSASEKLLPLVYTELRRLAKDRMANERADHTLQSKALVHEAYIRLVDTEKVKHWDIREDMAKGSDPMPGSLGAVLYRAGHAKEAVDSLIEASRKWEQSGSMVLPGSSYDLLPGYTWYFLAMANHDLGRFAESQAWYDKAEAYTQKVLAQFIRKTVLQNRPV